ncbi:MAG: hypothetical protein XD82_0835 [Methanoculleus marisnigri]|jgi:hypothetical protein|uniref:Uncharacterized protein n=1 Tax=Methanoculleus marisnigri TaxID=2198 RepID=A0A101GP74_9EURY|nr:hypothetical protein [Methanoculleus marisnigri]KUK62024.1 MAG: hypothetical protein XD82_0835 [Methanoculleus marisnigri]
MNQKAGRQAQAVPAAGRSNKVKRIFILSLALLLLAFGAGCTDSPETNGAETVTPAPVLHYQRGDVSIPINVSEIPVRGFGANATEVIEILLADPRAGALLEDGWKITSVRTNFDYDLRTYVDVEFRRDEQSPSFFIEVDEQEGHTGRGFCNVSFWRGGLYAGPYPEDYHQNWTSTNRFSGYYVFDHHHNERVMMAYNETTIFYLYPSYGTEWFEDVKRSGE